MTDERNGTSPQSNTAHAREAARQAVEALSPYGHWSLVAVGVVFTFVSELVFFLLGPDQAVIHFLELLLPIVVGVGLVWYGFQFERNEYSSRQIAVISLAVLLGMGVFVVVATYTAFLLSLEHSFPEPNLYLLLNAMAIGAIINFVYGYQYVRIQRSRRQLESRRDRLVTIASMVSHDMRNPLNVALGRVELVKEREGDVDGMSSVKRALHRIESLTEELLVIARGEPNADDTETVSLESTAREAWQTVESPDAKLAVRTDGYLTACPDKLHHLLENLFRNAIEHGETTSITAVGALEDGEGFYVADDGRGIPRDVRDKILSHGYTTSEEGTGLGLYIVEEIAEAHGWEIRVTESADGGARFEFANVDFER